MKAIVVDKNYGSVSPEELEIVQEAFEKAGIEFHAEHFTGEEEIIAGCADAEVILATGNPPITEKVVKALPKLQFVSRFGIGVNSIDLNACTEAGVIVLNLPGFCVQELADMAAAMILGLVRNTAYYDREIRKGNWPKCTYLMPGNVREMTLGLFAFGGAARCLYEIFHGGFGTKVIAYEPYLTDAIRAAYPEVEFVTFEELLVRSDIISVHAPLTPETRHVFNRDAFRKMKNTAMIINTARGPLIDEEALIWALENGEILYAGLDTFEQEPLAADSPLRKLDNVITSAHCGSYGSSAKKTQISMVSALVPGAVTKGVLPARCVANRAVIKKISRYHFE